MCPVRARQSCGDKPPAGMETVMNVPNGGNSAFASPQTKALKQPLEPKFPALKDLPESVPGLFRSLALTVSTNVNQPDPGGQKAPKKHDYVVPWPGFKSWRDARVRLHHFEKAFKGNIVWRPFNDSLTNDGPMSLNAYPGRAFVERVTNEGDANLEAIAEGKSPPMPQSPADAAEAWFGVDSQALSGGLTRPMMRHANWRVGQSPFRPLLATRRTPRIQYSMLVTSALASRAPTCRPPSSR